MRAMIDITFDVRTDSGGKDPDKYSGTLRKYHKVLWSKPLPDGKCFDLDDTNDYVYLSHRSEMGNFYLTSDSIVHTYFKWKRTQHIVQSIPIREMDRFYRLAHTVGGYIIFPGNTIDGKHTLNQARGINHEICDRMDLTLECIRRFYLGDKSPLFETISRYSDFFNLFSNFQGYCEYFLLQDLVTPDFSNIKFHLPFSEFIANPIPQNVDEYLEYMKNNLTFLQCRNNRILQFVQSM